MIDFLINWAILFTTVFVLYMSWTMLRVARLAFIYAKRQGEFVKLREHRTFLAATTYQEYFFEEFRNILSDWYRGVHRVA